MKKNLLLLFLLFLIISCKKDENESIVSVPKKVILKPYMVSLISADTLNLYKGDHYIHLSFKGHDNTISREITFFESTQSDAITFCQSPDNSVLGHGWRLQDTVTKGELEISFHYSPKTDTIFNIWYANYIFANSWLNRTGANIYYYEQVESRPNAFYMYMGTDSPSSYFEINYIDKDRINGNFQTILHECCGEKTIYYVSGDFSIPRLGFFKYASN